jgi:glycosyltransferase involved in cell wall biosynthesis
MYISVSKSIIQPNLKYLGIKESKVELIQNGRDVTVFEKARIYSKSEIIPDATSESLLIITNSRVIRSKGFDEMLLAFQSLSKKFGNIFLVVAGNGFDFDFYKNMAMEMGLDGKVVFLGRRHDIPSLLKSCDLFWFASHYEGSPGVVIEGMLSKTPMILSDIEPVLENIQDRRHALIFKTGDAEDLAVKTEILIYDPEFGEKLASAAYELGSNHFDIKKLVNKQETLYLELIQQYENR